jgi:hypothetical protein
MLLTSLLLQIYSQLNGVDGPFINQNIYLINSIRYWRTLFQKATNGLLWLRTIEFHISLCLFQKMTLILLPNLYFSFESGIFVCGGGHAIAQCLRHILQAGTSSVRDPLR